ncbi:MAG: type II secretion system protein [Planctomycetes bacterium]|nr:type II secretion system protein [Planctomycetota bacterium]
MKRKIIHSFHYKERVFSFTLVELLVVMSMIVVLLGIGVQRMTQLKSAAVGAISSSSIRSYVKDSCDNMRRSGAPALINVYVKKGEKYTDTKDDSVTASKLMAFPGMPDAKISYSGFTSDGYMSFENMSTGSAGYIGDGIDSNSVTVKAHRLDTDTYLAGHTEAMVKCVAATAGTYDVILNSNQVSVGRNSLNQLVVINGTTVSDNIGPELLQGEWHKLGITLITPSGNGNNIMTGAIDGIDAFCMIYLDDQFVDYHLIEDTQVNSNTSELSMTWQTNGAVVDEVYGYSYRIGSSLSTESKDLLILGGPIGTNNPDLEEEHAFFGESFIVVPPKTYPISFCISEQGIYGLRHHLSLAVTMAFSNLGVALDDWNNTNKGYKLSDISRFDEDGGYLIMQYTNDGDRDYDSVEGDSEIAFIDVNYELLKYERFKNGSSSYLGIRNAAGGLVGKDENNKDDIGISRCMHGSGFFNTNSLIEKWGKEDSDVKLIPAMPIVIGFNGALR